MVSTEPDVNDIFDSILLTEESLTKEGFNEGYEKGLAEGNIEGYKLGYAKGYELGEELGNYYGTAVYYVKTKQSKAVQTLLINLKVAIEKFPKTNDPNVDILAEITDIRTLHKRVKAVLKLKDKSSSPEKNTDLTF